MNLVLPRRPSSLASLATGAACAAVGLWLMRHYPIEPVAALSRPSSSDRFQVGLRPTLAARHRYRWRAV